ncbi:retention module-containing protein [Janthinobacterium sp. B9-8]|uniref:retention module-containing protein n=1 Tax=Janthinobacterium sp. B9-8 TaxID=1236179 RepID=UPI0007646283|nr:retention module-containing protein [Janthinobacterium sp. B9-8]AMC34710.1 hypothetical protein VN23_08865 [Janthinobacterium sp. B9-8]
MAEQINTTKPHATIVQIDGKAYLRDASGNIIPLKEGQKLDEQQILVTTADGHVQLQLPNGELVDIGPARTVQIDAELLGVSPVDTTSAAIKALEASAANIASALADGRDLSTELEATAAGLSGAAAGEGHSFVQLLRIAEGVNPLAFNFAAGQQTTTDLPLNQGAAQETPAQESIQAINDAVTLDEDGESRINVLGNDVGSGLTVSTATATNGSIVINPDGTLTYKPNANFNGTDQITYTIINTNGSSSTATVAVTVNPVNDLPNPVDSNGNPLTVPVQITTKEDTPIAGKVTATDPDGDPLTFTPKDQPTHGTVTVNPDGSYVYTPAPDYNGKDSFTVTVSDGKGGTAIITVDVTVDPVNDAPVGANQTITTPEDTPITGKLVATDKDGDPLTFVAKDQPTHGTVTVKPDGSYEYTPAPDYNGKDSFTVTVSDGKGGTAIITVDVGITPADDPANISGNDQGTVQEDGVLIANGKLTVSDKDAGQSEIKPQTVTNEYGTFSIAKDGTWSFTLDNAANAVQSLSDKDSLNKTYLVESLDGTKHNVVITINGKDDAAEITPSKPGDDAGQVKEDSVLTTGGTLLVNDKDAGQSSFQAQTDAAGTYGKFSIGTDGKWTYALNNAAANVQALAEGETKTETFVVKSADGTTSSVVVTIVGTNDAAIITPSKQGDDEGLVKEDTLLTATGTLLVSDKDAGQSSFQAQTDTSGTYGKFSIGTDGKWTYTLNNNDPIVQALKDGDVKTETFTVKSADGTTSTVTVTVNGTNESATVGHGAVQEDTVQSSTGTLTATGGATFVPQTDATGTYGKLTLGSDGKWTYTLNNSADNVQALKTGEFKTESFNVTLSDGTQTTITIDVQGLDDKAVITPSKPGDDAGSVKEDTTLTTSGTLLVNDKDAGQSSFQAQTDTSGTYGKFSIGTDGKWTYALNNAAANVQALAEGETKTETFTVKSADGTTSSVVVTVVGTDDAAVITPSKPGDDAGSVKEDTKLTTSGVLLVNDKDAGQSSFQAQTDATGTYGKFSIGTDGKWTYALNNAAANVQALAEGETKTETFTVKSADGTTSSVVVTIVGTNDAAVITPSKPGNDAGQVKEDSVLTTGGTLLVNDKDAGQSSFQAQTDTSGAYGKFSIGTDGKWTYTLNNNDPIVQALKDGDVKTETFTVKSADGTTSTVTVTVNGTNESATVGHGAVQEDTVQNSSGTLTATGGATFVPQTDAAGTYGKLTLGSDGKWTYTLNNSADNVQALKTGEFKTESFNVTLSDGTQTTITIDVQGLDDKAVITPSKPGDDAGSVKEDTTLTTSGVLLVNDKDAGQSSFQAQTDTNGTYGKFSIGTDGKWTYALNNAAANVQALAEGETKTETFTVKSADGSTSSVIVTVVGTNDAAVITPSKQGDDEGLVKEDTKLTATGTLLVNDKDAGQSSFQAQTDTSGTYGKFSIGTDGKWTYTLNNNDPIVQALKDGDVKTETFTVKSADGTTSTVTVTINGTNESATVGHGAVQEDTVQSSTGTLTATGGATFVPQTDAAGTYGKLTLGSDGKWTYTLNNSADNVQALKTSEFKTESFNVTLSDGTKTTITIDVQGLDDKAIITPSKPGDDAGQVKEDSVLTTGGTLLVNDKDAGQSSFQAQTDAAGTYGKFSIGTDGKWTYALNNAAANVQALAEGETKTETFVVKSADGTTSNIVVTVVGTNDAAVITPSKQGDDEGLVKEDTKLTATGTLLVSDKDAGQASFQAQTDTSGTYGKFSIGTDGKWTYALNNAAANVQALAEGETKTETFAVKSADGTTSSVVVTVVGTNDAAIITPSKPGDDAGQVKEDSVLTTGGTLLVNDKDAGQSSFQAQTDAAGTYGKFSIGTDGKWTYALNNAAANVQALAEGETKTETFVVKSADGTTSSVVVTIVGTNDAAIITPSKQGDDEGLVKEDTLLTATGTLLVSDKDAGQSSFQAQTDTSGTYGKFSIGTDGKWTYTLNNNDPIVQALKDGDVKTETFTVKSADGTTSTVTVTVNGTNESATVGHGAVQEDTVQSSSGTLTATGGATFVPQTDAAGTYGKLTLGSDGKWTYTLNNSADNVQALKTGEFKTESFNVTLSDGTKTTITIDVQGLDDKAIITPSKPGDNAGQVKEDSVLTTGGTLLVNDKDAGQSSFQAQTDAAGTYGKFSIGTDGKWTYALNNAAANVQALAEGETKTETFTVKSADGTTSSVVVTVVGTNDVAIITPSKPGDDAGSVKEDTKLTTSGILLVNDKDAGQSNFQAQTDAAGTYGKFSIGTDGKWTYALNNAAANVQALAEGETKTETFAVKSADGTTSSVVVTVVGTNDAAIITPSKQGDDEGLVKEDTLLTTKGILLVSDKDAGQASFQAQTDTTGVYGKFSIGADGKWAYVLNNTAANVQALNEGETKTETFVVMSADGTTSNVVITVKGTNDTPSSTGGSVSGSEDTAYAFTWNDFNADSVANSLSIKLSSLPADGVLQYNGVTITNPSQFTISKADIDAGKLTFVPDANESGSNSFSTAGVGDQKSDYAKFDYQVSDGGLNSAKVSMVVDIKPVADIPVISIGGISLVNGSTSTVTPPKGDGLTQQYYAPDANDNLNTTTARTPTHIEAELEGKVPTSTTIVSTADVYVPAGASAPTGIATDSAYRVSGLVYMEEGKTYTFSGYVDDTSLLKIGGKELMNRPYDGYGNFTATPFVAGKSGYYTVEFIVYNASNVGAMDLNVSVNGAAAIDFNATNFSIYSSLAQLESKGGLHSNLVATGDGGYYPQGISGQEDSFIKLFGLAAKLSDTDGSESLQSLSLTELKAGSTVYDGVRTFNVVSDGGALNLTGWDLNNLQIKPPLNFFGEYKVGLQAVSIENSTGQTATNNAYVSIQVANTNDVPTTSDDSATIREDSTPNPITGNVLSNDVDVDGDKLVVQAINNNATNVGKAISGQFGLLTINADGSYSYTLDNSNPRVNALNDRDTLSEKFSYTVSDGKGGTSTATLTINIQGNTDPVVIMGSSFNDQIGDMYGESNSLWTNEKTEGTVIDLQLGGGAVAGAPNPNPGQRFQYTQSVNQVIDAGGGNDYVESGRGDDVIYAGDSDSAGYKFADILGHKLMTLDLGSLVDSSTQLFSAAVGVSNPKADVVNGGSGNDAIFGQAGVDLLYGHTGNDYLDGGNDNDALRGGLGNDVLRGGSGNDVLKGDAGDDTFLWMPGDQAVTRGATAAGSGNEFGIGANVNVVKTATDVVMDFNQNTTAGNNDKLDMRDLLIGETHGSNDIGNLLNYLHVEKSGSSTVIHVSTAGEFNGGYNAAKEDQTIILQGVDLTGATDADILKNLLQNNKLIVD